MTLCYKQELGGTRVGLQIHGCRVEVGSMQVINEEEVWESNTARLGGKIASLGKVCTGAEKEWPARCHPSALHWALGVALFPGYCSLFSSRKYSKVHLTGVCRGTEKERLQCCGHY